MTSDLTPEIRNALHWKWLNARMVCNKKFDCIVKPWRLFNKGQERSFKKSEVSISPVPRAKGRGIPPPSVEHCCRIQFLYFFSVKVKTGNKYGLQGTSTFNSAIGQAASISPDENEILSRPASFISCNRLIEEMIWLLFYNWICWKRARGHVHAFCVWNCWKSRHLPHESTWPGCELEVTSTARIKQDIANLEPPTRNLLEQSHMRKRATSSKV